MGSLFASPRFCLIVEHEPTIRMQLEDTLQDAGINIFASVESGEEALLLIDGHQPDVAIINPAEHNTGLVFELRRRRIPFIVFTACSKAETPAEFSGAPVIQKPLGSQELLTATTTALSRIGLEMKDHLKDRAWEGVFLPPDLTTMRNVIEAANRDFDPYNEDSSLRYAMASAVLLAYEEGVRDQAKLYEAAAKVANIVVSAAGGASSAPLSNRPDRFADS